MILHADLPCQLISKVLRARHEKLTICLFKNNFLYLSGRIDAPLILPVSTKTSFLPFSLIGILSMLQIPLTSRIYSLVLDWGRKFPTC